MYKDLIHRRYSIFTVYYRYCQHQIRDIAAVATGLRPLRGREVDGLRRRSAAAARSDEWTHGRPPLATSEHAIVTHRRGGSVLSTTNPHAPPLESQTPHRQGQGASSPSQIEREHFQMRLDICNRKFELYCTCFTRRSLSLHREHLTSPHNQMAS